MSERYFAYGSNLCIDQMVERIGPIHDGADRPRIARLPGYRLVFNMQCDCGQVYANVLRPGGGVLGVIYCCSSEALSKLDEYEQGYERQSVWVVTVNGETLEAFTYVARPPSVSNGGKPSAEYLHRVVRGARQHGLPEAYIWDIEAIASGNDD
jgi:gamma-glutamylcyclotransferase (GGCT)/AIG2-like uncharacterized protein YtfP